MPKITYIEFNNTPHSVEAKTGISLMKAAVNNGIPGIEGECGGSCSCATCHVYVEKEWTSATGPARGVEVEMLQFTTAYTEQSRLACQIDITDEMDGLVVRLPEYQG
jgi:ferredoxin, 2Fe-2S